MDILFIGATRTVHTCRTAALHAILSFLISLFASYDPQSHKILQFYCFQILLSKKVTGPWLPAPLGFADTVRGTYSGVFMHIQGHSVILSHAQAC